MEKALAFLFSIFAFLLAVCSRKVVAQDDACSLQIYAPFTVSREIEYGLEVNIGFTHMAATLMAMRHFNERDPSVVPELADPAFADCSFQFDINNERTFVFDSGMVGHQAGQAFQQQEKRPCAMLGTMDDLPALDLSTLAATSGVPLVVNRALNRRVSDPVYSPNTVQMFPEVQYMAEVFWDYLRDMHGRDNHLGIVYSANDSGLQKLEALSLAFEKAGARWTAHPYLNRQEAQFSLQERSIYQALQHVREAGQRTIIVAMDHPHEEIYELADAAHSLGLNDPDDYFWVFFGDFEFFHFVEALKKPRLEQLIRGSAWMAAIDPFWFDFSNKTAFLRAWKNQTSEFVDLVNSFNPIPQGEVGFQNASGSFFEHFGPQYGSSFAYDAVMTLGIGACSALLSLPANTSLSVDGFVSSIQSVNFTGASGRVEFGVHYPGHRNQSRYGPSVTWSDYNILPPYPPGALVFSPHTQLPGGSWLKWPNQRFWYANGGTEPPKLLRDERLENYLPSIAKSFGWTLLLIVLVSAFGSSIWIFCNRRHRVLLAAQPPFLYCVCVGAVLLSLSIVPLSFDEGSGWDSDQLGKACMAIPWLFTTGYVVTYSALFTKLWRVNKVLQASRRQVKLQHVAWPAAVFLLLTVVVLVLWTTIDPLRWVRSEVGHTTETVGRCESENVFAYAIPLIVILLIPSLLTELMAWKTRDVDGAYSESVWIFVMVLVQMEVLLFSVPLLVILNDESTTANYIGIVLICWMFPMSALVLIMLPKFIAYYKVGNASKAQRSSSRRRGSVGGLVHVTGLTPPVNSAPTSGKGSSKHSKDSENRTAAHLTMQNATTSRHSETEASQKHEAAEEKDNLQDVVTVTEAQEAPSPIPSSIPQL